MGLHVVRCVFLLLMAPAIAGGCGDRDDVECSEGFRVVFDYRQLNEYDRITPIVSPKCNEKITYTQARTGHPSLYFPPVQREELVELELSESVGGAQDQTPMSKQLLLLMLVAATMVTMKPMTTMMVMVLLAVVLMLSPPVASFDYPSRGDIHYLLVVSNPDAPENEGCNTRLHWFIMGALNNTDHQFYPPTWMKMFTLLPWITPDKESDNPAVDNRYQFRVYALPEYPYWLYHHYYWMKFGHQQTTNFDLVGKIERHYAVNRKPARLFQIKIDKNSEQAIQ